MASRKYIRKISVNNKIGNIVKDWWTFVPIKNSIKPIIRKTYKKFIPMRYWRMLTGTDNKW